MAGPTADLPLVLLPGTLCDARLWQRLTLPEGVQALSPGCSQARSAFEAARQVLDQAPPQFAVLGMSMGGATALEVLAQAPERVRGLALVSSHAGADLPGRAEGRAPLLTLAREQGLSALIQSLWPSYVHPSRHSDSDLLALVTAMAQDQGLAAYAAQLELLGRRTDHHATLSACTVPVLIAAGQDDVLCPPALQERLAQACPHAQRVMLQACGHFSPLEAPTELSAALAQWLSAVAR